jgi:putative peptidoglycan lipid II flippase
VQALVVLVWTAGNLLSWALLPARWIVVGVALAMSAGNLAGAVAVLPALRRRLGGLDGRRVLITHLRLLAAALVAGGLAWLTAGAVHLVAGDGRVASALALAAGATVLLGAYALCCRGLRVRELDDLLRPVVARVRRAG